MVLEMLTFSVSLSDFPALLVSDFRCGFAPSVRRSEDWLLPVINMSLQLGRRRPFP